MREEEKIFAGKMFDPRRQELKDIKHTAHEACQKFNQTDEYDPARQELLRNILGKCGETFYCQGPVQFNYGCHTFIGENFFANFNFTVMDDMLSSSQEYSVPRSGYILLSSRLYINSVS